MAIASRVKWYLDVNRTRYEVLDRPLPEPPEAEAASIPASHLAHTALFEDEQGYLMVVLPASRRIDLQQLNETLHRHLEPVSEEEADSLFFDCETGSVPAIGSAYGLPTLLDDTLLSADDVYFDAGDRSELVHVDTADFIELNSGSMRASVTAGL